MHAEQVYKIPPEFEDYERREPVKLEAEASGRASIGELYEARNAEKPTLDHGPKLGRDLTIGRYVAYKGEAKKRCRLGQITSIFAGEKRLAVHALAAQSNNRLRVVWAPMSKGVDGVKVGPGDPLLETITFAQVITTVELNQGVISHASARRLDRAGWRIDQGLLSDGPIEHPAARAVQAETD